MCLRVTGPNCRNGAVLALFCVLGIFGISYYYHYESRCTPACSADSVTRNYERPKTITNITNALGDGVWTISSIGRLGNQMGEYATLYALAKLNGHPAYIRPKMFNFLAPIFKISLPQLHESVIKRINWRHYGLHNWMSEEYKSISGKYVHLDGVPFSWTFYHHLRKEILREFTFHDFIKEEANAYLEKLKGSRKNATYIGVHVRRGDYLHIMPQYWKGVVADKGYLDKAMAYFLDKYQEPVFVVTSNHTIMTIGTFGIWASYLAGGEVIYLDNFTLPESQLLKFFHYDAAFLPEWKGIPADLSPLLSAKP